MKFASKKNLLIIFILILIIIPVILPLFTTGFFVTDDGEWMIIRFSAFHQAFRDGELPVRFLGRLNQEYGYPVATFLYPGFMYLAESIHLAGFNFVNSIKILLGLSIITSGIFTYLWLRKFFDTLSSAVGAIVYIYTPYHLYDLYKRGSVGELLALAILPFILWQFERRNIFWSAFGIALLILSHNTLAALFLLFIVCYVALDIYKERKKVNVLALVLPFLFGFGIAAFFWIPALFELRYTVFAQTTISNWREYFASFSLIGYATFVILLITIIHVVTKKIVLKKHRLTGLLFILAVFSLFLATAISIPVWHVMPVGFIQFPFRVLSLLLICIAFLAAVNLSILEGMKKKIAAVVLVALVTFSSIPFLQPASYFDKSDSYYATNMDSTTVQNEYMPVWVKEKPTQRPIEKGEVINGKGKIQNIVYNSNSTAFTAVLEKQSTVRINTIYWPGWKVFVDNKEQEISYKNPKGLLQVTIPEGTHQVKAVFSETPIRLFSDLTSIFSLIGLIFISLKKQKLLKKKK